MKKRNIIFIIGFIVLSIVLISFFNIKNEKLGNIVEEEKHTDYKLIDEEKLPSKGKGSLGVGDSNEDQKCIPLTKIQLMLSQSVQENNYYCVPACLQMVLKYKNINRSQSELAAELNTKEITGTEYIDLTRVVNKYLFNNENVGYNEPGYHIQTLTRYDNNPQIANVFERRVRSDISTDDPVFVAVDVKALYPHLNSGNHMIVVTGYALYEGTDNIAYYYIDPSYVVQDSVYGGLKTATKEELINAIIVNDEPAYIY